MGTKRIGLARVETLIENLKRELSLGAGSAIVADVVGVSDAGSTVLSRKVATATTGTIAVDHSTDNPASFTQPAGTHIKHLICIPAGDIVSSGVNGDDFDVSLGTSANGVEILGLKAILDDGGAAVTWPANKPLYIIQNGKGAAANAFTADPATSEAMTLTATTFSAAERTLHINFKALDTDLTTADTTIKVICVFSTQ